MYQQPPDDHLTRKPVPYQPGHKNHLADDAPVEETFRQPGRGAVLTVAVFFCCAALGLFLSYGLNPITVIVVATLGFILVVAGYFGTRDQSRPPSRAETIAATCWLWFRRTLCWGLGLGLLLGVSVPALFAFDIGRALGGLIFGIYLIYLGWFGISQSRIHFSADIKAHQRNKARYKWRL